MSSRSILITAALGIAMAFSTAFSSEPQSLEQVLDQIFCNNLAKSAQTETEEFVFPPVDVEFQNIFSPGYPPNGGVAQIGEEFWFAGPDSAASKEMVVVAFRGSELNDSFELPNLTTSDGLTKKMNEKFILVDPNGSQIKGGLPHYIFLLNGEMVDGTLRIKIYGLWMFYFGYRAPLPEVLDGSCWPTSIADTLYIGNEQIPQIQVWASNPEGETLMIWCYVYSLDGTLLWWLQEPLARTPQYFYPDPQKLVAGNALLVLKISNGKRGIVKQFPFVVAKKPVNLLAAVSGDDKKIEKFFDLSIENHPNPFNPTTTIEYGLQSPCQVFLKIFDLQGREIATLIDGMQLAGEHSAVWNATGQPSGIYIYHLSAGGIVKTGRMMFLK